MQQHAEEWTIEEMANLLSVSRSGYYRYCKHKPSQRQQENEMLISKVKQIHAASRETYGSPRIHAELVAQGYSCSRPRVARLMKQVGIVAKMQRLFKRTTRVNKHHPVADNLLQQNFSAEASNQKWVADINYCATLEGWLYIAVVLDLFSRQVVGLAMSDTLQTTVVMQVLEQAIMRKQPKPGLTHHSDKGCQYTSTNFQALLAEKGITCSMSGTGCCFDNAAMESFFHTLKTEQVYFNRYLTREGAKADIFEYVEVFYNQQRRHSTLGYVTPLDYEKRYYQQQGVSL
jgi:putative transposase